MVDIWWLALAFFCGGYFGMLVMALLALSRQDVGRSKLVIPGLAAAAVVPRSVGEEEDAATG